MANRPESPWQPSTLEDILRTHPLGIIGAVELVYIAQFKTGFPARIDTGASTSSVDARNIQPFERDGSDWVRFELPPRPLDRPFEPADDEWPSGSAPDPIECERPVVNTILIERAEGANEERFVVELSVHLGSHQLAGEFSLNDRSEFEYAVLIGRNLLAGNALVDAGRGRLLGPPAETSDAAE